MTLAPPRRDVYRQGLSVAEVRLSIYDPQKDMYELRKDVYRIGDRFCVSASDGATMSKGIGARLLNNVPFRAENPAGR
jgi:hypothetical protein